MPPGGGFTGNRSVDWFVEGDNNRETTITHSKPGLGGKPRGHRHEGIEETPPNHHFEIKIYYPRNSAAAALFREQLAAAATGTGDVAELTIPIEDENSTNPDTQDKYVPLGKPTYQITVDWKP